MRVLCVGSRRIVGSLAVGVLVASAGVLLADDLSDVAVGSKAEVAATDAVIPGDDFTAKPKIIGHYSDPIKDPDQLSPKKASAKVLDKPTVDIALPVVAYEWKKKIALYDKVAFKAGYKAGTVAAEQIITQTSLVIELELFSKQLEVAANIPGVRLNVPSITAVEDQEGTPVAIARAEDFVVLRGNFFGTKPPKVWLENMVDGVVKMKKLKVIKPLTYPNAAGKLEASCMNPVTGTSELLLQMPSSWPSDWGHAESHNLVLDNGIGISTVPFGTASNAGI
jgi:hypothetical protein